MNRRRFIDSLGRAAVMAGASGYFARGAGANASSLTGEYGFFTNAVLGPQEEAAIRARVDVMARDYGIREFQFYDWFADYSTPVRGGEWTDPYFRHNPISRRTIEITIDEIHRQGGRAWAYVQSVGAEEQDLEDAARDIWKLRDAKGQWHWHPPGFDKPRFPTYFPNAAWAKRMAGRWAGPIKQLGFDGIHWDTLGAIAGDYGAEVAGIHAFIKTTRELLQREGLRQTMNMVDLCWWNRAVVRETLEFPYVEIWSHQSELRYYAEMMKRDMAGIRGVMPMYPSVDVPNGWSGAAVVCARHDEARKHRLAYLVVGDGARRMKGQYWPDTVPLTEAENACLKTAPASVNHGP